MEKIKRKCKVVLKGAQTSSYPMLHLQPSGKLQIIFKEPENPIFTPDNKQLCILNEDTIQISDWLYDPLIDRADLVTKICDRGIYYFNGGCVGPYGPSCYKVIASTDHLSTGEGDNRCAGCIAEVPLLKDKHYWGPSSSNSVTSCIGWRYIHSIPKPSKDFILKYVEEYNKGNKIDEVLVDFERLIAPQDALKPIIDKDNRITITKIKDSWDKEEVKGLITKALKECRPFTDFLDYTEEFKAFAEKEFNHELRKWFKENL